MADLHEIAQKLNIKLNTAENSKHAKGISGRKRRTWVTTDETDKPGLEIGLINPISKPGLSTPFTNQVDQPHSEMGLINLVYQPHSEIGLINQVDQPRKIKNKSNGVDQPDNISLSKVRGNPLKVIQYIFEFSKITEESSKKIQKSNISKYLGISMDSLKTALRFLLKAKIIIRKNIEIGRNGGVIFELSEKITKELIDGYKTGLINPIKNEAEKQLQMGFISSSSNYKITTTTSAEQDCLNLAQLEPQWNLDITALEKIGFTENHLLQIAKRKTLEPSLVQESIYAFAHDLENNAVQINSSPLNFFMGILNKSQPYVSRSAHYETPKEKALRLFLERETRLKQQSQAVEMTLMQKARSEWFARMSFEEQTLKAKEVHSQMETGKDNPSPYRPSQMIATLEQYFERMVWPEIKLSVYQEEGFSEPFC